MNLSKNDNMASREEINLKRLLHRCEAMALSKQYDDWRLEKYVGTLQEYLQKLRTMPSSCINKPQPQVMTEYTCKVDFLKGLLDTEKLASSSERVMASDLLTSGLGTDNLGTTSKELHLQTKARYQREMRDDLMSAKNVAEKNGLRQRMTSGGLDTAPPWRVPTEGSDEMGDLDTVIKHQQEVQEKLAQEMVSLARNMKDHASAAHRIVKDDTMKLSESNTLADKNLGRLKVESERLDHHVQKSCNWWLWLMLAAVCFVFVWMIIFIRIFPKR